MGDEGKRMIQRRFKRRLRGRFGGREMTRKEGGIGESKKLSEKEENRTTQNAGKEIIENHTEMKDEHEERKNERRKEMTEEWLQGEISGRRRRKEKCKGTEREERVKKRMRGGG